MRERARCGVSGPTRDKLNGVSLERRRALRWILVPSTAWLLPDAWAAYGRIASARVWPAQEYTRLILESQAPIEHQLVVLRDPNRVVLDLARIDPSPSLAQLPASVQSTDPYIASGRRRAASCVSCSTCAPKRTRRCSR
jgi:hypothetical protein